MTDAPLRILSIDGGGIRGIIPATVLAEVERRTGKPVAEAFDLIAGTSTGGILALALTRPGDAGGPAYRAEDLVGLYEREGPGIFSRSLCKRIRSVDGLLDERYPSHGLEDALDTYLGDARLSDALTDVIVPAYDIERRGTFFFKSRKARIDEADDFAMRDAAHATSAAPTYFEPVRIERGANQPCARGRWRVRGQPRDVRLRRGAGTRRRDGRGRDRRGRRDALARDG